MIRILLVLASLMLAVGAGANPAGADTIPLEDFFAPAALRAPRLSPDGKFIAYIAPMEGRRGIALLDVATAKSDVLVRTSDENIDTFFWKGSDYIVFGADVGGNEAFAWQSIHVGTRKVVRLIESYGENNYLRQGGDHGSVLEIWPAQPREFVVYGSGGAASRSSDYHAVNVVNGSRRTVLGDSSAGRGAVLDSLWDQAGRMRIRVVAERDAVVVQARLGSSNAFRTLFTQPVDLLLSGLPKGAILADNRTLVFVDYRAHDRGALVSWDLDEGRQTAVLFEPPEGEISAVRLDRLKSRVLGVQCEAAKTTNHWFDADWARLQQGVDQALPTTFNQLLNASDDLQRVVVHVGSDREPGGYFLLDRTAPKPRLMPIGAVNPRLDPKRLAPMEPVTFTARDGLVLNGYLTRASDRGRPGPMIINPHGGPYGIRDGWGYVPEVQFLASRGYSVLQVNYRGSGGYGRRFLEAGRHEWGGRMQDDLTDAVRWAVEEGIADPKRVVIYGASYGGYAALAGAAFTPDLYCCAVNYVGVADLSFLGDRDMGGSALFNRLYYEPWLHADREVLHARSPLHAVAAIRIPTLHAYGENDPRVDIRHWKALRRELDRHQRPYEFLREGDEGHGFEAEKAQYRFYRRLETFLIRHAPPG